MPIVGTCEVPMPPMIFAMSKAVEPRRIVHQDFMLQRRLRRHQCEQVDQVAVVRHVLADVGMRPVGAPQDPVRRGFDQRAGERHRVGERRSFRRHALGAANLDPAVLVVHELEQGLEGLLFQSISRLYPSHVVDHHGNGQFHEQVLELHQVIGIDVKDQVPPKRTNLFSCVSEKRQIRSSPEVLHKIEAHAADAALVHLLKFPVSIRFIDDRGAAVAAVRARDGIQRDAHVRAMAARVHDDGPFNSQHVVQFSQSFEWCVRRAIGGIRGIREFRRRAEHMAVRIAGERRRLEFRCASVRVGRCCGFHGVPVLYGPMKLGMFMMPLHPPQRKPAETYAEDREAVLLADRLGYCEALVGEHVTDLAENVTSCLMFLASLAHDTKNIVLGSGTINMPNTHPAHVAAQVAMIDHLLKGRFIMGISPGGLMSDAEAFGNYKKDRNAIFLESINMVLDIWAGSAPYNLSGQFFSVTTANTQIPEIGQGAILKPYQKPHPPIVVTAVAPHSKGVTEAAKRGWKPISANFLLPQWVASHWPRYQEGCKAVQKEAQPSDWRVAKSIFVADDDKVAKRYGHGPEGPYHFYF